MKVGAFQPEPEPRRGRAIALAALLIYLGLLIGLNVWFSRQFARAPVATPPIEQAPVFPEPNVLHKSLLALQNAVVAVPYQAGAYELTQVVPAELTTFYRHSREAKEGRVVLFTNANWHRWQLMAEYPAAQYLGDGFSEARLATALETTGKVGIWDRIFPWRLVAMAGRRNVKALVLLEGHGAAPDCFWQKALQGAVVIGREYPLPRRTGRRIAVTLFKNERVIDILFTFDFPDPDNLALVRAWLEAVDPAGLPRPNNEAGLTDCTNLPGGDPDDPAIVLCRKLFMTAAWLTNRYDVRMAARLAGFLAEESDVRGLEILAAQLSLKKSEEADVRRLLGKIEAMIQRLNAAPPEDETSPESEQEQADEQQDGSQNDG